MIKLMDLLEDFPKKKKKDGEESQDSGPKKVKTAIPDDPFHKDDVEEGGPGSGPHSDDEDNPFDTEPSDDDLAAIEKEFEGVVKEGPSYEYAPYMKKIEKAENLQAKQVNNLVKLLQKKGLKKEATELSSKYMKGVRYFDSCLQKLYRKLT